MTSAPVYCVFILTKMEGSSFNEYFKGVFQNQEAALKYCKGNDEMREKRGAERCGAPVISSRENAAKKNFHLPMFYVIEEHIPSQ